MSKECRLEELVEFLQLEQRLDLKVKENTDFFVEFFNFEWGEGSPPFFI